MTKQRSADQAVSQASGEVMMSAAKAVTRPGTEAEKSAAAVVGLSEKALRALGFRLTSVELSMTARGGAIVPRYMDPLPTTQPTPGNPAGMGDGEEDEEDPYASDSGCQLVIITPEGDTWLCETPRGDHYHKTRDWTGKILLAP